MFYTEEFGLHLCAPLELEERGSVPKPLLRDSCCLDMNLFMYVQSFMNGVLCNCLHYNAQDVYLAMKEKGNDLGSQVSVFHNGKEVVNLWGGYMDFPANTKPYQNNTLNVCGVILCVC